MSTASILGARLSAFLFCTATVFSAAAQDWIWSGTKAAEEDVCFFRKAFRLGDTPDKARLSVACDNKASIYLDGKPVGENDDWNQPAVLDLAKQLKAGDHLLAIRAENHGGPAGLIAKFEISFPTTKRQIIQTDKTWQVSGKEVAGWNKPDADPAAFTAATALGKHGMQPWGLVLAAVGAVKAPERDRKPGEATTAEVGSALGRSRNRCDLQKIV